MSTDYNSKLIASLYEETEEEKASEIADEMLEIGDAIFIQPLYSAYKKFFQTSMSHYFVQDISNFKNPEATEILKSIAREGKESGFSYCLSHFIKIELYELWLIEKTYSLVFSEIGSKYPNVYSLETYLEYLRKAKSQLPLTDMLRVYFEDSTKRIDLKTVILKFLLKENPADNLTYYLENFEKIKGDKSEIILAKEIVGWKGSIIKALKEKIMKIGSPYAKEIIEDEIKKEKKEQEQEQEKKVESNTMVYSNADIVSEIYDLRNLINVLSLDNKDFAFALFPDSEILFSQIKTAQTKADLDSYCIELRSFLTLFNKNINNHGLDYVAASKLIANTTEDQMRTPLNQLELYMTTKNKTISEKLFGLRNLIFIVNKFAHPDDQEGLVDSLQKIGLIDFYKNNDWSGLHRKILEVYRDSLVKIRESLS
ncbi:MAG: hypothetical protein WAV15_03975 [Minisyncoccia bacterium]